MLEVWSGTRKVPWLRWLELVAKEPEGRRPWRRLREKMKGPQTESGSLPPWGIRVKPNHRRERAALGLKAYVLVGRLLLGASSLPR